MARFLKLLVPLITAVSISCQSYTTTLKESPSKVDESATISSAQTTYSVSNNGNYGNLKELVTGGYLDSRFNSNRPVLYGYAFTINTKSERSTTGTYSCNADPDAAAVATGRHFYIDSSSAEVHVNETQPASPSDPTLRP